MRKMTALRNITRLHIPNNTASVITDIFNSTSKRAFGDKTGIHLLITYIMYIIHNTRLEKTKPKSSAFYESIVYDKPCDKAWSTYLSIAFELVISFSRLVHPRQLRHLNECFHS